MLRSMRDLENYSIRATDGDIGRVKDFYFDDRTWTIRHLIVDTSSWIPDRKVLISPMSMDCPDWCGKILPVKITKEQVKSSPDMDTDKPVSKRRDVGYLDSYGYPYYCPTLKEGDDVNADSPYGNPDGHALSGSRNDKRDDLHLRSCKETIGYHVDATDDDIGHVRDLLIDECAWAIRYIVVSTSNWFGGHQVLIAPQWIRDMSWAEHMVSVHLTRQQVKDALRYDAREAFSRQEQESLYRHYGLGNCLNSTSKDQAT